MRLPKDKQFSRRGAFPLLLLLLVGVVVLVSGAYLVREQFLKEGKSGKTAYDQNKIQEQIDNPQKLPEVKEEPKGEMAVGPYVYNGSAAGATSVATPSFSIVPPVGWEKFSPGGSILVQFKSTEEDRVDQEDGLFVKSNAQISVGVQSMPGKSLEEILPLIKNTVPTKYDKVTVITERKTKYAGQDAYYFEVELASKGVSLYSADYYIYTNGYVVHTAGTALKEFWSKRGPAISGSLATFRLL
ncbi:hypothetical protein A2872_02460 [Candidatus Gottesmanbacteria bacterium RIFCSPHIGHO2_01_FULL_42_12]|uniref:PsbP C-terminal domain-containing protein n=1 Tax=Candidatus Gottesmanbacteria bacterium RIFCSPHIGHO2_01_FULL_42_12 TaxID=1798377 RepID=A0A1F5Z4S7_9BACT|nr:MAG: hypothetical protein A2872_02460 [Candidatus Gottesmanbacteria bacterium RIFCSPHIGHO2_01_FULL_42_12]